jgi:hypothetical protein
VTPVEQATATVNFLGFVLFLGLVGATLFSMLRRIHLYRVADLPLPTLLKRGFVLFGSLALIGGEIALLRLVGVVFAEGSVERLAFIIQSDAILIGALLYYTKAELFDLDDEDKP